VVCYALAGARRDSGGLVWIACCWALATAVYFVLLAAIQRETLQQDLEALWNLAFRRAKSAPS
jgi:hypothetical protein